MTGVAGRSDGVSAPDPVVPWPAVSSCDAEVTDVPTSSSGSGGDEAPSAGEATPSAGDEYTVDLSELAERGSIIDLDAEND